MIQAFKDVMSQDRRTIALVALALFCSTAPLELSQIIFVLVGAVAYALLQATQVASPAIQNTKASRKAGTVDHYTKFTRPRTPSPPQRLPPAKAKLSGGRKPMLRWPAMEAADARRPPAEAEAPTSVKQELRTPSSKPIVPPTFSASGWEAEVEELIGQVAPTPESDRVVEQLASIVKQILRRLYPEIEVVGFTSGDLLRGTAFGVAVPEVDIVAVVNPTVLAARQRFGAYPDARKLHKAAIRACTDKLVNSGKFKFRRSAFRGREPKVTLLVPESLGIHTSAIPIDFSINCTIPLYLAALRTHCGQIDPRAKDLMLLVRRWAKDRGICHAAKGHLSPYAWSLMIVYYLQAGLDADGGALLPPVEDLADRLQTSQQNKKPVAALLQGFTEKTPQSPQPQCQLSENQKSVAALLRGFFHFYAKEFDWRNEAVSVRRGKRGPPELTLPLHIVMHEDGKTTSVGPSIEDPVEPSQNLGDCITAQTFERLLEELRRADEICSRQTPTLSELLELWVPLGPSGEPTWFHEPNCPGGDEDAE